MLYNPAQLRPVRIAQNRQCTEINDQVYTEIPIALVYNGISYVVLIATPAKIAELVIGFSFSEGIIQQANQIYTIDIN